jgi:hypothetical protein
MFWFCCWVIALRTYEHGPENRADWMKPPAWSGNYWGPTARRARLAGQLPPLTVTPAIARWARWGRSILREGDIVFRLGDARAARGILPLSRFIARATGSPFSHTGVVTIEDGGPMVYDCSSDGIRLKPFEFWMLDCVGAMGVKRLKPEYRRHIPGVIGYCRKVFEQQVPFDYEFRMDDAALYCLEMTEKAFRSQGLALSDSVRIGDWEHLDDYPLTALAIPYGTGLVLEHPITLEQPVYVPGNDHQGVWASPLLEPVFGPEPKGDKDVPAEKSRGLSVRGDVDVVIFAARELRRSYSELPVRWMCDVALHPRVLGLLADRHSDTLRTRPGQIANSSAGSNPDLGRRRPPSPCKD